MKRGSSSKQGKLRHQFGNMEQTACGALMSRLAAGTLASNPRNVTCPRCQLTQAYREALDRYTTANTPSTPKKGARVRRPRVAVLTPAAAEKLLSRLIDNEGAIKVALRERGFSEEDHAHVCEAVRALADGEVSHG